MPRKLKRLRPGGQISASDFNALFDEVERLGKFTNSGGMSSGPGGIILPPPEDAKTTKLVKLAGMAGVGHLDFASRTAFGTEGAEYLYGGVSNNDLTKSYKNYVPTTDKINGTELGPYVDAKDCDVYEYDGRRIRPSGETVKVINFHYVQSANRHWAIVTPLNDDVYVVTDLLGPGAQNPVLGFRDALSNGNEGFIEWNESLLLNQFYLPHEAPGYERFHNFAHSDGYDVFIHAPGFYKITYGVEITCTTIYRDTVGSGLETENNLFGPAAHSHNLREYLPTITSLDLISDYGYDGNELRVTQRGGVALNGNKGTVSDSLPIVIVPARTTLGNGINYARHYEKTTIQRFSWDKWHGGLYTRLCLGFGCYLPQNITPLDPTQVSLRAANAYLIIEPIQSTTVSHYGFTNNLGPNGSYQWYGGGPEPPRYNRNGTDW